MGSRVAGWGLRLAAALALTAGSALVPRPAYSAEGLRAVRFGYPLPFLTQNLSGEATAFPARVGPALGRPAALDPAVAAADVGFYLCAVALGRLMLRRSAA